MKVTKDKEENRQAYLTVEMEPPEVEQAVDACYKRLAEKANIPGFRKGKAPQDVLERHLGRDSVREEAVNDLIPKAYRQAVEEQGLKPIGRASIEITQGDPLVFQAVVPLEPIVELGDYHKIRVKPKPVKVSDNDIDALVDRLHHQRANWEPVKRAAKFNDMAVLDIASHIEDKPFINQQGAQYLITAKSTFPTPGFAEALEEMNIGEEKEFQLQIPPDHPKKEMAGKSVSFKVKVTEIKEESLPELNDEFAQAIDPEIKTMKALRERIAADLKQRAEEKAEVALQDQAIEKAAKTAKVEYPPVLEEMEIDQLISQRLRRWQKVGTDLEEYLKSINKTEEEIREEMRPQAAKRTVWSLVLGEIAEQEKVKVEKPDIDAEIKRMVAGVAENSRGEMKKLFNSPQSRMSIEQKLLTQKTVGRLMEIAKSDKAAAEKTKKEKKETAK